MSDYIVGESSNRFNMGANSGELTTESVAEFGLGEGLQKFGKQLLEQYPHAVGIKITGIEFVFCLKQKACEHERLNEDGICRSCGEDCR